MQITLYSGISKRRNSTALPTGSGTNLEVYLKEATSIMTPIFILEGDYVTSGYNYAYFNNRYYWINDIVSVHNNLTELHCEIDVLATYRLNIMASTAFIAYAATAHNAQIIDPRISQITYQRTYHSNSAGAMFASNGCIVLQYISGSSNDTVGGGVCADAMYSSSLAALTEELYTAGSSIWDNLVKQAGSVSDCLAAAVYLPIDIDEVGSGSFRAAMIGDYQSTYGVGKPITSRFWTKTTQVSIPWPVSDFRKSYCDISVSLPYAGVVKVSPADVYNDTSIDVICIVDKLTGKGLYYLGHNTEDVRPFMSIPFQCGASIAMSSYQNNILGGVQSAISTIAGTVATGNPLVALTGAVATASDIAQLTPSIIGQNTGAISFSRYIDLVLNYRPTAVEPSNINDVLGRPYMAVNALSGFSGYIQTKDFSLIAGLATGMEKERVNELMDSGVYLE